MNDPGVDDRSAPVGAAQESCRNIDRIPGEAFRKSGVGADLFCGERGTSREITGMRAES